MSKQEAGRLAGALTQPSNWVSYYGVHWHPKTSSVSEAAALLRQWPDGEPVHQFRTPGTSVWYDGHADQSDGGGPYETRTLYTAPLDQSARIAELESALKTALKELKEFRNRTIYGEDTF